MFGKPRASLASSPGTWWPVTRLELPLHYVSTVDCEDLALLRQKRKLWHVSFCHVTVLGDIIMVQLIHSMWLECHNNCTTCNTHVVPPLQKCKIFTINCNKVYLWRAWLQCVLLVEGMAHNPVHIISPARIIPRLNSQKSNPQIIILTCELCTLWSVAILVV